MKKINFILLVLSCVFAFAACSKNDGDDDVPKPEMKYKQVKQIVSYKGNDARSTTDFKYDDKGRLIEESDIDGHFTYTYSDKQIVKRNGQNIVETYTLGDDGRITEIKSATDGSITTFSYSSGRLQKTFENYPQDGYDSSESYFWNGNLTKTTYNTSEDESGETVYEYGDLKYINNANIDLFAYVNNFFNLGTENTMILGLAGERSWYLPTKLTTTEKEDGQTDVYVNRVSYVQDEEGYITRFTIDWDDEEERPTVFEIIYND